MASRQEIEDEIHSTLVGVLTELGIENADPHVRLIERSDEPRLPGYEFETFESDLTRGLGSNLEVDDVIYNDDDTVTVVTRRRRQATVDILAHAGDDNRRTVTKLYDAAERDFDRFTQPHGEPTLLHEDIDDIDVQGTTRLDEPQDRVRGDRLRVQIEYHRFTAHEYESMQQIDTNIEVSVDLSEESDDSTPSGSVTTSINSS